MSGPRNEFFEANQGRTELLMDRVSDFMVGNWHMTVIVSGKEDDDLGVTYTEGLMTPEDYVSSFYAYGEIPPDDPAHKLSENANENILKRAVISTMFLQERASSTKVREDVDAIDPNDQEALDAFDAQEAALLKFDHTVWQHTKAIGLHGEKVELTHSRMTGLDHYDTASQVHIHSTDGLMKEDVTITKLGDQAPTIMRTTEAQDNPAVNRAITILGKTAFAKLFPILTGGFRNEEQLDDLLSGLWAHVQTTSHEEEITPILDELRLQAIAHKNSIGYLAEFGLTEPTDEQFSKLEDLLLDLNGQ